MNLLNKPTPLSININYIVDKMGVFFVGDKLNPPTYRKINIQKGDMFIYENDVYRY